MDRLQSYSETFKWKYDKFLIGCDAIEELDLWDKDALGEMDVYYTNDLISVIVCLIAADEKFTQKEVDYINDIFGFSYTTSELERYYQDYKERIDHIFDEGAQNGLSYMKEINPKLAAAYKDLLVSICDIIIASDEIIETSEIEQAKKIRDLSL